MTTTTKTRPSNRSQFNISDDVEKIKAALYDTSVDLKGRAGEILNESVDSVKDQSAMVRDNVADYTTRKPFKALGIALVAGLAIGILLRRR